MKTVVLFEFADAEVPSGKIDGVNTNFQLAAIPYPPASLQVYRNGLLQGAADFRLAGQTTIFAAGVPRVGDSLIAYYRH